MRFGNNNLIEIMHDSYGLDCNKIIQQVIFTFCVAKITHFHC